MAELQDLEPLKQLPLTEVDALCLGPGLGSEAETLALVRELLAYSPLPAVVDASALQGLPDQLSPRILLTPRHGELARLVPAQVPDIERDRLSHAVRAARN